MAFHPSLDNVGTFPQSLMLWCCWWHDAHIKSNMIEIDLIGLKCSRAPKFAFRVPLNFSFSPEPTSDVVLSNRTCSEINVSLFFLSPPQMANQNGKSVVVRIPTEPQSEPNETETSPLNQRGRDNNSDVSSSTSAVNSEQSTKKLIEDDMRESRRILLRIGIDFLLLCCGKFWKTFNDWW